MSIVFGTDEYLSNEDIKNIDISYSGETISLRLEGRRIYYKNKYVGLLEDFLNTFKLFESALYKKVELPVKQIVSALKGVATVRVNNGLVSFTYRNYNFYIDKVQNIRDTKPRQFVCDGTTKCFTFTINNFKQKLDEFVDNEEKLVKSFED